MKQPLKILFTGDFYGGHRINSLIQSQNYGEIVNDFLPIIRNSEIAVTNLESPLTNSNKPIPKTGPFLKSNQEVVKAFKFAGFNLVTLANNHIMDYGIEGLKDTLDILTKNDIKFVGAGFDFEQASSTLYKTVYEKKIAFLNFAENEWSTTIGKLPGANPLDPVLNHYAIKDARDNADFVFVIVHGGHEMYNLPSPRMKKTYRFFIDSGANAVIAHHPHVISGYEIYKNCPIFYSLGNFIFDKPVSVKAKNEFSGWNTGLAVQFKIIESEIDFELIPHYQNTSIPGVQLLSDADKNFFYQHLHSLNEIIQNDDELENEFEKYCLRVGDLYKFYIEPHSNKYIHFLQRKKVLPSFLSKKKRLLYKNLIRCESHKDIVLKTII
ncbi:MAG: CapA family protein [Ignavibacterium sp.]